MVISNCARSRSQFKRILKRVSSKLSSNFYLHGTLLVPARCLGGMRPEGGPTYPATQRNYETFGRSQRAALPRRGRDFTKRVGPGPGPGRLKGRPTRGGDLHCNIDGRVAAGLGQSAGRGRPQHHRRAIGQIHTSFIPLFNAIGQTERPNRLKTAHNFIHN